MKCFGYIPSMKDISSLVQYNVSLSSHCSLFCQVPNLVAGSVPCYSERDTRGKEGGGGGGCEGAETERAAKDDFWAS